MEWLGTCFFICSCDKAKLPCPEGLKSPGGSRLKAVAGGEMCLNCAYTPVLTCMPRHRRGRSCHGQDGCDRLGGAHPSGYHEQLHGYSASRKPALWPVQEFADPFHIGCTQS